MNEIMDWMQSYWYEFGMLFGQFLLLLAVVWFARKILRTMRASQEQVGALLRLSLSDEISEHANSTATAHRPTPYVMADWPATSETAAAPEAASAGIPAVSESPVTDSETPALTIPGGQRTGIIGWLRTPMKSQGNGISPWRKVLRWLQAPARS